MFAFCTLLLCLPCLGQEPAPERVDLTTFAPTAEESWVAGWAENRDAIGRLAALTTRLRMEHFLAQTAHESGGYTRFEEALNYSAPRLRSVWPRRFKTDRAARRYAGKPRALAKRVYSGRMGNDQLGDGWRYRGRGPMQVTGRDMYRDVGALIGVDLMANPDLLFPASDRLARGSGCLAPETSKRGCGRRRS